VTGYNVSDLTGSHVTGRCPDRKYDLHMFDFFPALFFTRVVVQVPWLPEATEGHVTPFGGPLCMCMRNRKLRNIRPMGLLTGSDVMKHHPVVT
jgi:hypothetical protein